MAWSREFLLGGAVVEARLENFSASALVNVTRDQWQPAASMAVGRSAPSMTLLGDGKVFVVGGDFGGVSRPGTFAEIYDPASDSWSNMSPSPLPRTHHTATLLPDGRLLVAGGWSGSAWLAEAHLYDAQLDQWTSAGSMNCRRVYHTATLLQNGTVLVTGGVGTHPSEACSTGPLTAELYDPASNTWTLTGNSLVGRRSSHSATRLTDGRILLAGGSSSDNLAEIYDPATRAFSPAGMLVENRVASAAALLPDGRVLVTGGQGTGTSISFLRSAEIFDPASNLWSAVAGLAFVRYDHTMSNLDNGRVLVAGGSAMLDRYDRTEVFDIATQTWSAGPNMLVPRSSHRALRLQGGALMVCGQHDYSPTCELYW